MRQAWMNGIWVPRMWFRYRGSFCWRHAAPLGFTGGLLSSLLLGLLWRPALWAGLTGVAVYLAVTLITAVSIGARNGWKLAPWVLLIMPCYHFLYGLGTWMGLGLNDNTKAPVHRNADLPRLLRRQAELSRAGAVDRSPSVKVREQS
jgi:hypothetical protein